MDLDMEPNRESLWWTSTHKRKDMTTLRVGSRNKTWEHPFREVLEILGYRYNQDVKAPQGAARTMCKGLEGWWRDKFIYCSKTVPMLTRCRRVLSHVYSTVRKGSINWPWSAAMIEKVRARDAKILRYTLRPRMKPKEIWAGYRKRTAQS